jgi:hypothetical protein
MALVLLGEDVPEGEGSSWIWEKEAVDSLEASMMSEGRKLDFSACTVKVEQHSWLMVL